MSTRRRRTKSGSKEEPENFETGYGYAIHNSGNNTFIENNILDSVDMTCRDRTGEFLSAVKSLQSGQVDFFTLIIRFSSDYIAITHITFVFCISNV